MSRSLLSQSEHTLFALWITSSFCVCRSRWLVCAHWACTWSGSVSALCLWHSEDNLPIHNLILEFDRIVIYFYSFNWIYSLSLSLSLAISAGIWVSHFISDFFNAFRTHFMRQWCFGAALHNFRFSYAVTLQFSPLCLNYICISGWIYAVINGILNVRVTKGSSGDVRRKRDRERPHDYHTSPSGWDQTHQ